jgi:N-acetylglucosamine kinase-like BadF-type ATPase
VSAGLVLSQQDGRTVVEVAPTPIAADPDGRVVRLVGLPLDGLETGAYELRLEVRDQVSGARIERREPFTSRGRRDPNEKALRHRAHRGAMVRFAAMTGPELLLAVDGGGTKTQAVVADLEGKILARGLAPSSTVHNVGFEQSCQALTTAIEGALVNVLGPQARQEGRVWRSARIAAACFGLAGIDSPEDEAEVSRWVREQAITPRFAVINDSELILAAGTPEGWGVALVGGTGSVCLGRTREGRTIRVGGWGPIIGDEGSGYQIAISALHRVTQTADGRADAKALLDAVLRHWSLREAGALIRHVHAEAMTPSDIAGLASVVLDLATRGDAHAKAIVEEAASDLARHVQSVVKKMGVAKPPLALAGGLLRASLRQAVLARVREEVGAVNYVTDPPLGGLVLARRLLAGGR